MDDLGGVHLVVNTVEDTSLAEQIYERACRDRLLINSYDQPGYSNFGMAALVHPGPLRISISTSNASPALASRLRQDLDQLFDEEFVEYIVQLGRVRQHLRQQMTDRAPRMELLRSLVADFRLEGGLRYPEDWREKLGRPARRMRPAVFGGFLNELVFCGKDAAQITTGCQSSTTSAADEPESLFASGIPCLAASSRVWWRASFSRRPGLEMGLAAGRDVDDFAGTWVPGGGLRPGILDLKHAETSNFYAVALNQAVAHGDEKAVDHLRRQVLFAPGALTNEEGEILLRYGRQEQLSRASNGTPPHPNFTGPKVTLVIVD